MPPNIVGVLHFVNHALEPNNLYNLKPQAFILGKSSDTQWNYAALVREGLQYMYVH